MALKEIKVPDLGSTSESEIIEIVVKKGDHIKKDDHLLTLESEKASMEVPSPMAGVVEEIVVKVGDKVSTGSVILKVQEEAQQEILRGVAAQDDNAINKRSSGESSVILSSEAAKDLPNKPLPSDRRSFAANAAQDDSASFVNANVHAGPSVRRWARELGVDLSRVKGTGPKNRIVKEDLQAYVKGIVTRSQQGTGSALPQAPVVDFSKFGEIETKPLSKIKKFTAINLSRNWLLIPHVTQFHEADITVMEAYRKAEQKNAEKEGVKLTVLAFLMKAVADTLKAFPNFNASLSPDGGSLILKKYCHLGVAVETPEGLVVPVIRDVDKKNLFDLAKELGEISQKARTKGLAPAEMQGSCFTISSLGGIGGTAFTPIVNLPDVAILGVSKASMKPVYQNETFVPRLMLPLSLSYDHRVIDGAEGARFVVHLASVLESWKK